MNPIRRKAIKAEFEKSNLTLEELCQKYNVELADLGDTSSWEKGKLPVQSIISGEVLPPAQAPDPDTNNIAPAEEYDILDEIYKAKKEALVVVKDFFTGLDLYDTTPKDIKDMMAVLKDMEAGELAKRGKGGAQPASVQVIVQNIMNKFSQEDV